MFAAAGPPWWGVAVLSGGFTLVGVAVTQLFNERSTKRQNEHDRLARLADERRDDDLRWQDNVRLAGADLLAKLDGFVSSSWSWQQEGYDWDPEREHVAIWEAQAAVELISPKAVVEAGRTAVLACNQVHSIVAGHLNKSPIEATNKVEERKSELVSELRKALGVDD